MADVRLIDANALMEYFERLARSLANARCFSAADAAKGAAEKVSSAPAIDAVPVVRCWECKHYTPTICHRLYTVVKPFDFCSYGKPKMDGGADNGR